MAKQENSGEPGHAEAGVRGVVVRAAQKVPQEEVVEQEFLEAQGRLPLARTTNVASWMLDGAVRLLR